MVDVAEDSRSRDSVAQPYQAFDIFVRDLQDIATMLSLGFDGLEILGRQMLEKLFGDVNILVVFPDYWLRVFHFMPPLLPPLRKLFTALGAAQVVREPSVTPAPKVWVAEGDVMTEYAIYLGGTLGFELLRETAQTIGKTRGDAHDAGK